MKLTPSQRAWVDSVIGQFGLPNTISRNPESDWVNEEVAERFSDALRIHHAFSRQPLTKDRFEFAFERALSLSGISSDLVESRTNRGHDLTIEGVKVSLKTEAASGINAQLIHVSKWMELGRGIWDLGILRDIFLKHLEGYDRIFTLRCLKRTPSKQPTHFVYELVEIPKYLMLEASTAELILQEASKQNPKPGYGYVYDLQRNLMFALYFDGGTERKLQIKHLSKSLCFVHCTWEFDTLAL